jgi:hypothetical protein
MQHQLVQPLLLVVEQMELNEQQMLVGIMQTFFSKVKVILLLCIAQVALVVAIQFLYQHQFLMEHFGITMV